MEFKINITKERLSTPINNKPPNKDDNPFDASSKF